MWFIVVCTLIDNEYASLLFFQTFFSYCFFVLMQRVLRGNSDAYKQLICIMQRVHFQIRVVVFSCQDKDISISLCLILW